MPDDELDLRVDDASDLSPGTEPSIPTNLKQELRALKKKALKDGLYNEAGLQAMIDSCIPLEEDLLVLRRIMQNGGHREQLAAAMESLKLKRIVKGEAVQAQQTLVVQATPEELQAMFGVNKPKEQPDE
jgi:hypothetical protein